MVKKVKEKIRNYSSYFGLALMFSLSVSTTAYGQGEKSAIRHAVRILKGLDEDESKEWAISILEHSANKDSSAYAMNCLGVAYMAGIGVAPDSVHAISYLESAGQHGYLNAYHNLGVIFKYSKCGVKQDFKKAFRYFSVGAKMGAVSCMYDTGYMLYKGLGCNQNYAEAVKYFQIASESQHCPSMYMLGLCYRNGFGVGKDTILAKSFLNRAAIMGYKKAEEELCRPHEETYMFEQFENESLLSGLPIVSPTINDTSLIAGNYNGCLVMYDWSGKYLIGEKPMAMSVNKIGTEVKGQISVGNDTIPFKASIATDNSLNFKSGNLKLHERYTTSGAVRYRLDNIVYDVWNEKIRGRLNLYSLYHKEPERPLYFELHRNGQTTNNFDSISQTIFVTPNPFEYSCDVIINLMESSDVQVRIYNISGLPVWQQNFCNVDSGFQYLHISPDIKPGKYVINVKAGKQFFHSLITKKGGIK